MAAVAFFRFEGVLLARPPVLAAAWLAAQAQDLPTRFARLASVALSLPFSMPGFGDSTTARRLAWSGVRGFSEDRLEELGAEYRERFIDPNLRPVGLSLVEQARAEGCSIVLLSDLIGPVAKGLAERIRVDHLICNQLEMVDGRTTGRLIDPVVVGLDGRWARAWCATNGHDVDHSRAYGASGDDAVLLAAVGLPCAVFPDRDLRRVARDCQWPIVDGV